MTFKQVNPGLWIPDLALRGLSCLYAAPVTTGLQDLAPYLIFILLLGSSPDWARLPSYSEARYWRGIRRGKWPKSLSSGPSPQGLKAIRSMERFGSEAILNKGEFSFL